MPMFRHTYAQTGPNNNLNVSLKEFYAWGVHASGVRMRQGGNYQGNFVYVASWTLRLADCQPHSIVPATAAQASWDDRQRVDNGSVAAGQHRGMHLHHHDPD